MNPYESPQTIDEPVQAAFDADPKPTPHLSWFAGLIFFLMNFAAYDVVVVHALSRETGPRTLIAVIGFSCIALVPIGFYLLLYGKAGLKKSRTWILILVLLQAALCAIGVVWTLANGKF